MKANVLRIFCLFVLAVLLINMLCACSAKKNDKNEVTSVEQLTTERIGVQTGTLYEEELLETNPDLEIEYYNYPSDMVLALKQGKLDCFLIEDASYNIEKAFFPWLSCLEGTALSTPVGAAISSNSKHPLLQSQLEEFIEQSNATGQAAEMQTYWISEFDPDNCVVDRSGITGENGTLAVAVENAFEPFSYYGKGELQGYDIDFIYRFCREYGYSPEFYAVEYDAIPVGISTGKFDVGMNIVMSEERSESITIVGPYTTVDILVAVMGEEETQGNILSSLADKFEKTFIKEDRWLLFVQGAGTTLMITILSALFGTVLGFILYLLCKKSRIVDKVNGFISWFIGGIPTILLLMVLYYVVFVGDASIGDIWVAIIGFTILFGYSMFDILSTSVSAVSRGQEEGARALGYSSNQTFFFVILPQALRIAFPQIKNELVSLIKETSIVGYISIADLTRMSDIVRGRTYEAFFPLITTTIIYFLLIGLILFVVKRVEIRMTLRPFRIKKIKRGINIK
ncbi:MAG: transporter substrate-binding domain-containing protein [Clostridia bacterium]|nr:transporter substrate-binding domain-containing protein [Clostridia bacterium]